VNDLIVAKSQVKYEQLAYWRNPMAAVFTFLFPIVFLEWRWAAPPAPPGWPGPPSATTSTWWWP
jgi:hypothetical protein